MIEELSDLEHEQWMYWSKAVATQLIGNPGEAVSISDEELSLRVRKKIAGWSLNWIPYSELSEQTKEYDRKWARKVLEILNTKEIFDNWECERWIECSLSKDLSLDKYCKRCVLMKKYLE